MKTRVVAVLGAAVALALAAPNQASANFHFSCPGCTTVGNGPTVESQYLYLFDVTTYGTYDFYASATASGTFTIKLYTDPAGSAFTTFAYTVPPGQNSLGLAGSALLQGNTTYYIGADDTSGPCSQGGGNAAGCELEIQMRLNGNGTPDTTVPEPASMFLLGGGLLGLAGAARRRKQRQDEQA